MTGFAYTALGKAVARYIKEAGLPVKINTDGEMLMASLPYQGGDYQYRKK